MNIGRSGTPQPKAAEASAHTLRPSTKLPTLLMLRRLNVIFWVSVRFVLGELVLPNGFSAADASIPQSASNASIVGGSIPSCTQQQHLQALPAELAAAQWTANNHISGKHVLR
jgi:hypothetical protein